MSFRIRHVGAAVAALGLVLTAAGCSASDTTPDAGDTGGGDLQTLSVVMLAGSDSGVALQRGMAAGYFADEGIEIDYSETDSPPSTVSAVVSGQYDIGHTSPAVAATVIAGGVDIRSVAGGGISKEPGNVGVLTLADSGITRWKDLEGKQVGVNAPRGVITLAVLEAVRLDGGDPAAVELVTLPLNQSVTALEDGDLDATATVKNFIVEAMDTNPDIVNLGDMVAEVFGVGALLDMFYASPDTMSNKAALIEGFRAGLEKSYADMNALPADEWRAVVGEGMGREESQWEFLSWQEFKVPVTVAEIENYSDGLIAEGWIEQIDVETFVNG
ncbi:ABC transporter substrate-binding protein [Microbacterium sp.]|uniref:ABC transporter substrate-binding protein n=1 Tax=Microbacterium sp. TaxID=51671 RepID=UPI003A8A336F